MHKALPLMLGITTVLATALLVGCAGDAEPEVPTEGLLVAEDLGPGDWEGPLPRSARPLVPGFPTCRHVRFVYDAGDPGWRGVVWLNGEVVVESVARRVQGPDLVRAVEESLAQIDACNRTFEGSDPQQEVTATYDGEVVTLIEHGTFQDRPYRGETAVTFVDGIAVGVTVVSTEGTTGAPSAVDLLPRAVEVSRDLPSTEDDE